MGTLYKRGDIWYINIAAGRKRIRKRIGTSKKLAEMAMKDLEARIIRREYDLDVEDVSLYDLFDRFLSYSEINHAPRTCLRYKNVTDNFRLFFDLYLNEEINRISELRPTHFEDYKRYRRTVDPKTIKVPADYHMPIRLNRMIARARTLNYEIKTVRSIIKWGIKHGLCRTNPAKDIPMLKDNDSKKPRFLTASECRQFLRACDERQYPIFFTFLNTGLRLGELINLQWSDIDLARQRLMIQKKDFWVPKAGEREVPLNEEMISLLTTHKPKRCKKSDFVFPGPDGGPTKRKLRKDVTTIAKRAGIDDFTKVHSLRHTFASHLVMSGVDLPSVQRLLGHADIETTMIYAHLAQDHLDGAVNKLKFGKLGESCKVIKIAR